MKFYHLHGCKNSACESPEYSYMHYAELWISGQVAAVRSRDTASGLNLQLVILASASYLKFERQEHKYLNTVIGSGEMG